MLRENPEQNSPRIELGLSEKVAVLLFVNSGTNYLVLQSPSIIIQRKAIYTRKRMIKFKMKKNSLIRITVQTISPFFIISCSIL